MARVNLAANSWSRSLLPMGERHLQAGPSGVRAHEEVPTARLDTIWDEVAAGYDSPG